ncbi:MAG: hypothetical protein U0V87_14635 [Acidobacteriota bacterium]
MTTVRSVHMTAVAVTSVMLLSVAIAGPAPVAASEDQTKPPADAAATANDQVIDQIQKDAESVVTGTHFTYDAAGRRDPFEPLIKTTQADISKRPKGISGMTVAEIALKGTAVDPRGNPVALFRGSDNRGYTLRVGDTVYDARVLSIEPAHGTVVFRQQVDDPRRIKPYRDVTKRLNPVNEQEEKDEEQSDSVEGA